MLTSLQVLNKILQTKDYSIVKKNGFDNKFFKGYENEFDFIDNHFTNFGNIPDTETFIQKFPDFELFEVHESDKYLVDKLYEEDGYNRFAPKIPELANILQTDSRDAYEYLMANLNEIKPQGTVTGVDIIKECQERYDKYIERQNAPEKTVIKTGFAELDEIFHGWEFGEELVTIIARINQGKCLEKGTEVLMSDGSRKKVEEIKVGDKVQSQHNFNTVTQLHHGFSKGYKIIPNRGTPFTVSEDHIMTFIRKYHVQINGRIIPREELVDMTIEDYLALSKFYKKQYFLFTPSLEFSEKSLPIPPYILGLWLGDGASSRIELSNMDQPIIDEWYQYASSLGLQVSRYHFKESQAYSFDITTGQKCGPKGNEALNVFKTLNLLNNKHIPALYQTASRSQRLQLLAGLIDTDGWYDTTNSGNGYSLVTKLKSLADDYQQLATGLGFKVSRRTTHPKLSGREERGTYYCVYISGNLKEIPVRLERKKCYNQNLKKNPQTTKFKVEIKDQIEYFGFACDGDHRFILGNGVLTHNSWLLMKFLAEAWEQGYRVGSYSGEMNPTKLGYRFDSLFKHYSNRCLTWGGQVEGYKEYIDTLKQVNNPFMITTQKELGGKATVPKLRRFIETNELEILGIDQFSLMDDVRSSSREQNRLKMARISEDLFLLSTELKIPIIGLAQANRSSLDKDEQTAPGLENIKESDDIGANSSKVIGLRQAVGGHLILDVIKNREGKVGSKLMYAWDIDSGTFNYIPSNDDVVSTTIKQPIQQQTAQQLSKSVNPF